MISPKARMSSGAKSRIDGLSSSILHVAKLSEVRSIILAS